MKFSFSIEIYFYQNYFPFENQVTDAQNSIYEYLEAQISTPIDETYPQEAVN
jgi:hypothetical protein